MGTVTGLSVEEEPEDIGGAETSVCGHRCTGAHHETPQQGVAK